MKWTNTKECLPDTGRSLLLKLIDVDDMSIRYCVAKMWTTRHGHEAFFACGAERFNPVPRGRAIFWIYVSEINSMCENSGEVDCGCVYL